MSSAIVWSHLVATIYLVGLIWTIQIVHYPLMGQVDREGFEDYHRLHSTRIAWIVILPMVIELFTAAVLVIATPVGVARVLPVAGLVLAVLVWVSTFAVQVPLHRALARGFDTATHRRLVRSNWVRTIGWSLRAIVAVSIAVQASA